VGAGVAVPMEAIVALRRRLAALPIRHPERLVLMLTRRPSPAESAADLLRALRRLPRRAAQGRHRQAADARHHPRQGHRVPEALINYGSPAGMPNWGTSGELTDEEVDIMARYLQHDPPSRRNSA
jgi:hypothetical protein